MDPDDDDAGLTADDSDALLPLEAAPGAVPAASVGETDKISGNKEEEEEDIDQEAEEEDEFTEEWLAAADATQLRQAVRDLQQRLRRIAAEREAAQLARAGSADPGESSASGANSNTSSATASPERAGSSRPANLSPSAAGGMQATTAAVVAIQRWYRRWQLRKHFSAARETHISRSNLRRELSLRSSRSSTKSGPDGRDHGGDEEASDAGVTTAGGAGGRRPVEPLLGVDLDDVNASHVTMVGSGSPSLLRMEEYALPPSSPVSLNTSLQIEAKNVQEHSRAESLAAASQRSLAASPAPTLSGDADISPLTLARRATVAGPVNGSSAALHKVRELRALDTPTYTPHHSMSVRSTPGSLQPRVLSLSRNLCHMGEASPVLRSGKSHGDGSVGLERRMRIGKFYFNKKPSNGIAYLVSHSLLDQEPRSLADFLFTERGLSRDMVGEYLGDPAPLPQAVLRQYVTRFACVDVPIDTALRRFLTSFRLPGEAQKIERIVEAFAGHYAACNPKAFRHPDTGFILSFSIIMLHTDLHNKNVPRHMTLPEFIANNRGIDEGEDLPRELLENIYSRIRGCEFQYAKDHTFIVQHLVKDVGGGLEAEPWREFVRECDAFRLEDNGQRSRTNKAMILWLFNDMLVSLMRTKAKRGPKLVVKHCASLFKSIAFLTEADGILMLTVQDAVTGAIKLRVGLACSHSRAAVFEMELQEAIATCSQMDFESGVDLTPSLLLAAGTQQPASPALHVGPASSLA